MANPDYSLPFIIQCDASDGGIGGVLVQGEGESERIVAYMSQKLPSTQRKYHTTERECLAVLSSIEKFRPYIEGVKFTVITDHASLLWLQNLKDPTGRVGRWALKLQAYDFDLIHRKGKFMIVADALSRAVETLDVQLFTQDDSDEWYSNLKKNVLNSPDLFPQYRVENNVVYKHCDGKFANNWRIVVPEKKRKEVLESCHDDVLSVHGGIFKTSHRVKRQYFWPKMESDIRKHVKNCIVCKSVKQTNVCQQAQWLNNGNLVDLGK